MQQTHSHPISLKTSDWINGPSTTTLSDFEGHVLLIEVFQMLCPGCVAHGIPQAMKAHALFNKAGLIVLGLHSVFEHHDVQGKKEALLAFADEYKIQFPIAIDRNAGKTRIPETMSDLQLQGTPTVLLLDRAGRLRHKFFGRVDDMELGAAIMKLLAEPPSGGQQEGCDGDTCRVS